MAGALRDLVGAVSRGMMAWTLKAGDAGVMMLVAVGVGMAVWATGATLGGNALVMLLSATTSSSDAPARLDRTSVGPLQGTPSG